MSKEEEAELGWPPIRYCNGGPNGTGWCGKEATLVPRDKDGMEWFACIDHDEKCVSQTIDEFWDRVRESIRRDREHEE